MINTTNIFDYEDVQLIPNKCIVNSRSECDTHVKLCLLYTSPSPRDS